MLNIMFDIDFKDRKILYELDWNSRAPLSEIGKRVHLSKPVVKYRIDRLYENGIIRNFHTVINTGLLGYKPIRFHFTYQYKTPEIEKQIVDYFIDHKYSTIVASTQGIFDLSILFQIKELSDFTQIWTAIQNRFVEFFKDQKISFPVYDIHHRLSFLMLNDHERPDREMTLRINYYDKSKVKTDDKDIRILKLISANARMPLIKIAEKCDLSGSAVKYRLKNLMVQNIIQGYRISIDYNKIGYQLTRVYIYMKRYGLRNKIINYIKYNPHLTWVDTTVGESHLELEFQLKNVSQLYQIMQDILKKFPDHIRNYEYLVIIKGYKHFYFPNQ